MNNSTIMEIMTNVIGEYHATTPPAVEVHLTGGSSDTVSNMTSIISCGISTLDVVWIASAILFIVAFVCIVGLIGRVLTAIVR